MDHYCTVRDRCNFRQIRRRSLPCFLTFHSPSPKTFSPVESITNSFIIQPESYGATVDEGFVVGGPVGDFELLLCHRTVCVVGKMRALILQLSKSSIYSTKPLLDTRLRRRSHAILNKCESRHALACAIFLHQLG